MMDNKNIIVTLAIALILTMLYASYCGGYQDAMLDIYTGNVTVDDYFKNRW